MMGGMSQMQNAFQAPAQAMMGGMSQMQNAFQAPAQAQPPPPMQAPPGLKIDYKPSPGIVPGSVIQNRDPVMTAPEQVIFDEVFNGEEYASLKESSRRREAFEAVVEHRAQVAEVAEGIRAQELADAQALADAAQKPKKDKKKRARSPSQSEEEPEIDEAEKRRAKKATKHLKRKLKEFKAVLEKIVDGSFVQDAEFTSLVFAKNRGHLVDKASKVSAVVEKEINTSNRVSFGFTAWALTVGSERVGDAYVAPIDDDVRTAFQAFLVQTLKVAPDFTGPMDLIDWDALA